MALDKTERDALTCFMANVLHHLHPNLAKYPLREMEKVEGTGPDGEAFFGTRLDNLRTPIVEGYYMNKSLQTLMNYRPSQGKDNHAEFK